MFMIAIKLVKFYSNSNTWTLKGKRYLIYCTARVFVANTVRCFYTKQLLSGHLAELLQLLELVCLLLVLIVLSHLLTQS